MQLLLGRIDNKIYMEDNEDGSWETRAGERSQDYLREFCTLSTYKYKSLLIACLEASSWFKFSMYALMKFQLLLNVKRYKSIDNGNVFLAMYFVTSILFRH
jgi:hypothetical protein